MPNYCERNIEFSIVNEKDNEFEGYSESADKTIVATNSKNSENGHRASLRPLISLQAQFL